MNGIFYWTSYPLGWFLGLIGASTGIGASTAIEFAKEGAKLSITGRNAENLNKTAKKCEEAGLGKDDVGILISFFF